MHRFCIVLLERSCSLLFRAWMLCCFSLCAAELNTSLLNADLSRLDAAHPYRSEAESLRLSMSQLQAQHQRELAVRDADIKRLIDAKNEELRVLDESRMRELGAGSFADRRSALGSSLRSSGLSPVQTEFSSDHSFAASLAASTSAPPLLQPSGSSASGSADLLDQSAPLRLSSSDALDVSIGVERLSAGLAEKEAQRSEEMKQAAEELDQQRTRLEEMKRRMRRALADSSSDQSSSALASVDSSLPSLTDAPRDRSRRASTTSTDSRSPIRRVA